MGYENELWSHNNGELIYIVIIELFKEHYWIEKGQVIMYEIFRLRFLSSDEKIWLPKFNELN